MSKRITTKQQTEENFTMRQSALADAIVNAIAAGWSMKYESSQRAGDWIEVK